jgi:hypothetical protein
MYLIYLYALEFCIWIGLVLEKNIYNKLRSEAFAKFMALSTKEQMQCDKKS